MHFDFSRVDETQNYVSVPPGVYECRVAEVRPGSSRDGSERWSFRLEVVEGEYAGRTAAWDSLTWSERALPRVKKVLGMLGFDVSGELTIQPSDLQGCCVRATVQPEHWEDPLSGKRITNNRVPFMGYDPSQLDPQELERLSRNGEAVGVADAVGATATDDSRRAPGPEDRESFDDTPF